MTEEDQLHHEPDRPAVGRIVAVDYGTVRIGIAISDVGRRWASPHENYTRRGKDQDVRYFRKLVSDEQVTLFVVGLPVFNSGDESPKSREAREFGAWLGEITGVPVEYYDERYTSAQAEEMLLAADLTKKRRKKRLDMVAAQIILASYLERGTGESHRWSI
ncbi:MAG: Holliday junction resolvase RuvX [Pirellulaceae bacterium]|nr:Holliday junction resolvase RuvX [Planctomycetales bacterium]